MSSSYSLKINDVDVPVTASSGFPADKVERALESKVMREWAAGMDPALSVSSIELQSVDMFGPRVGFLKFRADAKFHGHLVPGIVFMRGGGE